MLSYTNCDFLCLELLPILEFCLSETQHLFGRGEEGCPIVILNELILDLSASAFVACLVCGTFNLVSVYCI